MRHTPQRNYNLRKHTRAHMSTLDGINLIGYERLGYFYGTKNCRQEHPEMHDVKTSVELLTIRLDESLRTFILDNTFPSDNTPFLTSSLYQSQD